MILLRLRRTPSERRSLSGAGNQRFRGNPANEPDGRLTNLQKSSALLHRVAAGSRNGIIAVFAALIAYLPLQLLQLKQGFWSAIAAIAVVQSELQITKSTARDQLLGAAVGGTAGLCALGLSGERMVVYAAAIFVSMVICWLLNVASAARLSGITVTIMLLVPHADETAWRAVISRVSTVGWGVCVALATVWLAARLAGRAAAPIDE
jgi:uncharacterized membrane protein YccC